MLLAYPQGVADFAIAVELVCRAGLGDRGPVIVLLVPVPVRVNLIVQPPTVAEVRTNSDVLEVRLYVVVVVTEIVWPVGIVAQQIVIAELGYLRPRRPLGVRSVSPEIDDAEKRRHGRLIAEFVLILQRAGVTLLKVEGLVAVGFQLMKVDEKARLI